MANFFGIGKICKNNDHTCVRYYHTCWVFREMFENEAYCSNNFLRTREMLMHEKTCDPYIMLFEQEQLELR